MRKLRDIEVRAVKKKKKEMMASVERGLREWEEGAREEKVEMKASPPEPASRGGPYKDLRGNKEQLDTPRPMRLRVESTTEPESTPAPPR